MLSLILDGTKLNRGKSLICLALVISVFLGSIVMIQVNAVGCGTVSPQRGLIIGGDAVLRDQWPFIAALFRSKSFKYFCGGTIISNKHVLTAAHCIQEKLANFSLPPDAITVRLGAYNLTSSNETSVVDRDVTQIHMHPDWNTHAERYDADIAVLVLKENVTFSTNIRPVCLPTGDFNIEGVKGMVVGWGLTENGTSGGVPRKSETAALNDSTCYRQDSVITMYSSERSFCGVGKGAPNEGDSGGGYFVFIGTTWVQYGTVSIVRTNDTGHVVPGVIAAYTKLTSVKHWIADTVRQSGSSISEATNKINLRCTYGYDSDGIYGCWLYDMIILKPHFVVNSTISSHDVQKVDSDVKLIVFESGVMFFLPNNIGNIFKNLTNLTVGKLGSESIRTKHIFRSNFQSLEHLVDIQFFNNEIQELDEDCLWDLSKLESFQLERSKLKSLHAATFSRNYNLKTVYVRSSMLETLPQSLFENNLLLVKVGFDSNFIEAIDDGTFDQNSNLKLVSFKGNRLKSLSNNLFRNNSALEFVDFSHNAIKTIGEQSFQSNSKLKTLSLESNRLEYLPLDILQGKPFLERINLSNNSLKSIDERLFETNGNVSQINLRTNQLETVSRNLFHKTPLLRVVDLGENFIETIDEKLFETNVLLGNISLEYNGLNELPGHLFKHNLDLEFVNVRNNLLKTINEHTFKTNERLVEARFGNNSLTFVPSKLFRNNLLLETVDFANNLLETIGERTFQMNSKLQNVYLSSNMLGFLPRNLFRNNSLLEILDLSNNRIRRIDEHILIANQRLKRISLRNNQMESLSRRIFQNNINLEHIALNGNQLKVIEVNFIKFGRAFHINLNNNFCIDAAFYNVDGSGPKRSERKIKNFAAFQNLINANCTRYGASYTRHVMVELNSVAN